MKGMKKMNKINLKFDKTITGLAGNLFGVVEYEKQAKEKFRWDEQNEIIFPDHIKKIGISFIQGFFSEILSKIDKNAIDKYIVIKSSSNELTTKIMENLKF